VVVQLWLYLVISELLSQFIRSLPLTSLLRLERLRLSV